MTAEQRAAWLAGERRQIETMRQTGYRIAISLGCGHKAMFSPDDPLLRERTLETCLSCKIVELRRVVA